jgi:hypothetical protein
MKCKQVHKNFIGYIENTLSGALSAALHNHIETCPACKEKYENLLYTYTIFDKQSSPEITPFFYTRVEQRLKSRMYPTVPLYSLFFKRLQPVLAAVIIVLGISLGILVGKNLANSQFAKKDSASSNILEAYASEYYLNGTGGDIVDYLNSND